MMLDAGRPTVEVVVPVHDEERDLERCVRRLHAHLCSSFPFDFRVTIADNASADGTWPLAEKLAGELQHVRAVRLEQKGRGRALKAVWSASPAAALAYMDVDLSTGLEALLPLVAPLVSGHSDLAIGSRLSNGARVVRGPKRELVSRCYNLLLHATLGVRFADAQCGFKAIRADAARRLLPASTTTAGSSTPSCWCWPSAPACASTRCRSTGPTTRTRGSTCWPPPSPTCGASPGWPPPPNPPGAHDDHHHPRPDRADPAARP
jgi:Glycosyl transferase family 2